MKNSEFDMHTAAHTSKTAPANKRSSFWTRLAFFFWRHTEEQKTTDTRSFRGIL